MSTLAAPTAKQTQLEAILAMAANAEELPPLNIDQIDACIQEYELAERAAEAADAVLKTAKLGLIALVKCHGAVPAHAEQSKRLSGRRNQATITTATTLDIQEEAVGALESYLDAHGLQTLFHKLFATITKHTILKGAKDVLAGVAIRKDEHTKISSLFGLCIVPKPKAPSLKTELIEAEKPVRGPRGSKAGA